MFNELCSWENLYLAYRLAAKGKRGRVAAAAFEYQLEDHLIALQHELRDGSYRPGSYQSFYIHEPKRRLISAAPFRDRVVHHALCNLIEPIFERSFIFDSYANRLGKGTHRALDRCQHFARQYKYVLQCDVKQFFPSIDHTVLRGGLAKKIRDPDVMTVVDRILASGVGVLGQEYDMAWFDGDDLLAANRPRGLPIGNLTSQFWANCYVNSFDHFVQRELQCHAYARFVDDMVLFANDKHLLHTWHAAITNRMAQLRLTLHASAPKPVDEGVKFLGFRVFAQHRRLLNRKATYFGRRFRAQLRAYGLHQVGLSSVTALAQGWVNHVRYANTVGLRKAIMFQHILQPNGL